MFITCYRHKKHTILRMALIFHCLHKRHCMLKRAFLTCILSVPVALALQSYLACQSEMKQQAVSKAAKQTIVISCMPAASKPYIAAKTGK